MLKPAPGRACALALALTLLPTAPARAADEDWPAYNRTPDAQRYSPLAQITPQNAATLEPVCELEVGESGLFQTGPIVVGRTMYITTAHTVVALDAANCSVLWRHVYTPEKRSPFANNRGAAYLDGRLFRGTADGMMLAIDAATGRELWRTRAADLTTMEYLTAAATAWNGRVYMGIAGGDFGNRGRIMAFDAATGREVWRFHTIPLGDEPGAETWKLPPGMHRGGGASWSNYTVDPERGELIVPVGNPTPSHAPGARPGANLYTNAVVAIDAATGKLRWYYQMSPNDGYDYDVAAAPMVYRAAGGARRVAAPSKDGYLYVIDQDSARRVFRTPTTTILTPRTPPTYAGVRACPGTIGGTEWNGAALHPQLNAIYVGSVDWCAVFKLTDEEFKPGHPYTRGGGEPGAQVNEPQTGWITAVDADSGKVRWKYHAVAPVVAGVTATAGGVVFGGDIRGHFLVLDAANGREILKYDTGGSLAGGMVTYAVGGRQYVAFPSGSISRGAYFVMGGRPRLVVMTTGLGGGAARKVRLPDLEPAGVADADASPAVLRGQALYRSFCASCHGPEAGGGLGPALHQGAPRKDPRPVAEVIKAPAGTTMPRFYPQALGDGDVADVAEFLAGLKPAAVPAHP
ncbi:MAG: PQQ-binding-like beta-propeller repeat protein [Gammaproteobacteria bacterium]